MFILTCLTVIAGPASITGARVAVHVVVARAVDALVARALVDI